MILDEQLYQTLTDNFNKIQECYAEIEKLEIENKNITTQALRQFFIETKFLEKGNVKFENNSDRLLIVNLPQNKWLTDLLDTIDNTDSVIDQLVTIDLYFYKSESRISIYLKHKAPLEKVSGILREIHVNVSLKDFWQMQIDAKLNSILEIEQEIAELQKEMERQ